MYVCMYKIDLKFLFLVYPGNLVNIKAFIKKKTIFVNEELEHLPTSRKTDRCPLVNDLVGIVIPR